MHEKRSPPKTRRNHTTRILVKSSTRVNQYLQAVELVYLCHLSCNFNDSASLLHENEAFHSLRVSFANDFLHFVQQLHPLFCKTFCVTNTTAFEVPFSCKYSFPDSVTAELHYYWMRL